MAPGQHHYASLVKRQSRGLIVNEGEEPILGSGEARGRDLDVPNDMAHTPSDALWAGWNASRGSLFTASVERFQSNLRDRHRLFPNKVSVTGGEAPRNGPHPMANFAASFFDPVPP